MKSKEQECFTNEKTNPQAEELNDMRVTDEQAQLTKGGVLSPRESIENWHGTHVAGTVAGGG